MKVGVIQSHIVVGDFEGNAKRAIRDYQKAVADGAEIVVAPEDLLAGYCEGDQRFYPSFVREHKQALNALAREIGEVPLCASVTLPNEPKGKGKPFFNMAVFIQNGGVVELQPKTNLATDTVFNDYRWYEMNHGGIATFEHKKLRCAVLVCQDGWASYDAAHGEHFFPRDPVNELKEKGVDLVLMPNASPYFWKKGRERFYMAQEVRRKLHCAVAYANYWGGQDELVFDGRAFIVDRDGIVVGAARPFEDAVVVADLDGEAVCYPFDDEIQDLEDALVISLRDYVEKSGFPGVVLGLSGGVDSAVVAALAVKALGPKRVIGVRMPSPYSSQGSLDDAGALAKNLGIELHTIPIDGVYEALQRAVAPTIGRFEPGQNPANPKDVTEENFQARARGVILMGISNRRGHMVVSTGNKSEMAMGFATLYGDMCGGFALIKDVYKQEVFALARNMNKNGIIIPENSITKPPSAELRPGQVDSDALPPYDVLDSILKLHIEEAQGLDEIIEKGFDVSVAMKVISWTARAEYKRRQAPPGPIMTKNGLAWLNRQYPITSRFVP